MGSRRWKCVDIDEDFNKKYIHKIGKMKNKWVWPQEQLPWRPNQ